MGRMTNAQHAVWIAANRTGNLTVEGSISEREGRGPFGTVTALVTPADGRAPFETVLADMSNIGNREHPVRDIKPGDTALVQVAAWNGEFDSEVLRATVTLSVTGNPDDQITVDVGADDESWFFGAHFCGAVLQD